MPSFDCIRWLATFLVLTSFAPGVTLAEDDWSNHPEWSGRWKAAPELCLLLGYKQKELNELECPLKLHFEFLISKEVAIKALGKDLILAVQNRTSLMKHQIVAAGQWKEKEGGNNDHLFFVTSKEGTTYLWLGDQSKVINAAKISHIRGVTPEQDLLFLDFGSFLKKRLPPKFQGKAVGFRVVPDQPGPR